MKKIYASFLVVTSLLLGIYCIVNTSSIETIEGKSMSQQLHDIEIFK